MNTKHEEPGNELARKNASDIAAERPTEARRLAGRCADGAERDGGSLWHAVPARAWKALCGAEPGRRSAGWSQRVGDAVTCPRCARKLAAPSASRGADVKAEPARIRGKSDLALLAEAACLAKVAHEQLVRGKPDAPSILSDLDDAESALVDALDHVRWLQQRGRGRR